MRKTGEVPSNRSRKPKFAGRNKAGLMPNVLIPWHPEQGMSRKETVDDRTNAKLLMSNSKVGLEQ